MSELYESYIIAEPERERYILYHNEFAFKVYTFKHFIEDERTQLEFINEYQISLMSKERGFKNLIHQVSCFIGKDHIALKFEKYSMTFRQYLEDFRNPSELNDIISQIMDGVKDLHMLGYVHRDLKPDNVLINLKPLRVVVIDFNRAMITSTKTIGSVRSSAGYFPMREEWRNGSE